jgi:hypothetical protein
LVEEIVADGNLAQALGKSVNLEGANGVVLKMPILMRSAACENIVRNAIRFSPPGASRSI